MKDEKERLAGEFFLIPNSDKPEQKNLHHYPATP